MTMYREYLQEYDLEPNMLEQLRDTIVKLSPRQVDIFLGNHPGHNCTLEKRQYMLDHPGENPFINPKGWQIFLQALEARRADFEARDY